MKRTNRMLIGAAVVATMVGAAGTASAQTAAEAKCHATIAKNITKYQATLAKNIVGCHKNRNKLGTLDTTNCNETLGALSSDTAGKAAAAKAALPGAINAACTGQAAVQALYPRCPSPSADVDDAGTPGIDSFTEVAACLADLSEEYIERMAVQAFGLPDAADTPADAAQQTCVNAIGKAFSKAVKTVGKTYSKCQSGQEKLLAGLDYDASCLNAAGDPAGKAAASLAAITTAITTSCVALTQAQWDKLGTCGQSTSAMNTCAVARTIVPTTKGLVAAALELPGTCAGEADVIINAQNGAKLSDTRLDSGFTGLAQDVDVPDQTRGGVFLTGCNADCEDCAVTHNARNDNCRCSNDSSISCDDMNVEDNCGMGNTCYCMFGPPLPIAAGGTPVCVVNRFAKEFDGTTGVVGEYSVGTRTRALVHTNGSFAKPCPVCVGDPTPNDGNPGGTCQGNTPRNGMSCDGNVVADPITVPLSPGFGVTSFDCLPDIMGNVSGSGLNLGLVFTSGSSSLTAGVTGAGVCDPMLGPCHCSQCTGNLSVGCSSNTDCDDAEVADGAMSGAYGNCGDATPDVTPKQNACTGGIANCTDPDMDDNGACTAGPFDTFCDGLLRDEGTRGVITCSNNGTCDAAGADCDGNGSVVAGECGDCTFVNPRGCFLPTIEAQGTAGIFNSEGVSTFCSAETSSNPVNTSGGLPGPGRVKLDFDFNLYCDDGITQIQLPGGSNCP